jgi:hypothetical protein
MPNANLVRDRQGFALDPFGDAPQFASRLDGLGGHEQPIEPGYVFRTLPVASPLGPVVMRIQLHDLEATGGSLAVDLVAIPTQGSETPVKLATHVLPLDEMQKHAGTMSLAFEARPNMLYAVAGYIQEDDPVQASQIEVTLIAAANPEIAPAPKAGVERVELPRLTSQEQPDFGNPVSQPMTRVQTRHRDFRQWTRDLGMSGQSDAPESWARAFPLQVFVRYGVAGPQALGLCLHGYRPELAAVLATYGCHLQTYETDVAPGATPLPESDFDFVMSIDLSAGADALRHAIHVGLDRLKPDGLAVYVFTLGIGHVRREEIERFSLDTIAFGHEVAQLKFGSRELRQNRASGIPFGLIIRRS